MAKLYQIKKFITLIISTEGTKIAAILSTSLPIAGFVACACLTIPIICASTVSVPIRLETNKKVPLALIVPVETSSPIFFSIGIGSPVNIDSSMLEWPSIITPSTAIRSPGRTRKVSSNPTSLIGTSISLPSRTTRAVFGCSPIKRFIASLVFPRAFISSAAPKLIKLIIITAASK